MSIKITPFSISFYLYPKQLSHFLAVFEQIPAWRSIISSTCIVFLHKIDYSNSSYISISIHTNLDCCMYKYFFINYAKK